MDLGSAGRRARAPIDRRPWWSVYTDEQLQRAERRLLKSWRTRCPAKPDGSRLVSPDFFAANRVQSRHVRQRALLRHRRTAL
jgi:hypothetical protein